jgi:DNA-binding NarL/FixJ family response regulator
MKDPIRVVIVDDERLAREGVRELLGAEPDMAVVEE